MTCEQDEDLTKSPNETTKCKIKTGAASSVMERKMSSSDDNHERKGVLSLAGASNDTNSSNSSASTSRNGNKGGGYTADCSSLSDNSSDDTSKNDSTSSGSKKVDHINKLAKNSIGADINMSRVKNGLGRKESSLQQPRVIGKEKKDPKNKAKNVLPQWQGVRVSNPMDPRIDLSLVNVISAKEYHQLKSTLNDRSAKEKTCMLLKQSSDESQTQTEKNALLNQYNDLMNSLEESTSVQALSQPSEGIYANSMKHVKTTKTDESDSNSSMLVLARVKRKYQNDNIPQSVVPIDQCSKRGTNSLQVLPRTSIQQEPSNYKKENNLVHSQESSLSSHSSSKKNTMKTEMKQIVTDSVGASGAGTGSTGGTGSDQTRTETNSSEITVAKAHKKDSKSHAKDIGNSNDDVATQERLALKKRKRLDKRREYEAEVQKKHDHNLQSISLSNAYKNFPEGETITMEEALSFTSSPRLIVQADARLLAVHVNAAFSRFTGMHNSRIIGLPLSKILCIANTNQIDCSSASSKEEELQNKNVETSTDHHLNETTKEEQQGPIKFDEECSNESKEKNSASKIEKLLLGSGKSLKKMFIITTLVDKADDKNGNGSNSANEGSNNSSITSKDDSLDAVRAAMSICVIVSTPPRGAVLRNKRNSFHQQPEYNCTSTSSSAKEMKHKDEDDYGKKDSSRTSDTSENKGKLHRSHFLVQLFPMSEKFDDESGGQPRQKGGDISVSSNDSPAAVACG